jgi:hypothetical protein
MGLGRAWTTDAEVMISAVLVAVVRGTPFTVMAWKVSGLNVGVVASTRNTVKEAPWFAFTRGAGPTTVTFLPVVTSTSLAMLEVVADPEMEALSLFPGATTRLVEAFAVAMTRVLNCGAAPAPEQLTRTESCP